MLSGRSFQILMTWRSAREEPGATPLASGILILCLESTFFRTFFTFFRLFCFFLSTFSLLKRLNMYNSQTRSFERGAPGWPEVRRDT